MKFLVTTKPRETTSPPADQLIGMLERSLELQDQRSKTGVLDCSYFIREGETLAILTADSIEDVWTMLMQNPFFPFSQTEVTALVDGRRITESYIEFLKSASASTAYA